MSLDFLGTLQARIAKRYGDDAAQDAIVAYLKRDPRPPVQEAAAYCWNWARWEATSRKIPRQFRWADNRLELWNLRDDDELPKSAHVSAPQLDRLLAREALESLDPQVVAYHAGMGPRRLRCSTCNRYLERQGSTWRCTRGGH